MLKLLSYTARRFPGVVFNGRAADVIRVIGRILPLALACTGALPFAAPMPPSLTRSAPSPCLAAPLYPSKSSASNPLPPLLPLSSLPAPEAP